MPEATTTSQSPAKPAPDPTGFNAVAAVLAYAFPGLGHVYLGQIRRGLYIAAGMLGLILGGLLVGGIDSVDSREDRVWYIGQVLAGPVVMGLDALHHSMDVDDQGRFRSAYPGEVRTPDGYPAPAPAGTDPLESPPYVKSLGKANEFGTLLITLAGMLNIIVVLDALLPPDRYAADRRRRKKAAA